MRKETVNLLYLLRLNNCDSPGKGWTVKNIVGYIPFKYTKTLKDLNELVSGGYVAKGYKSVRADTFYITDLGTAFVMKNAPG
jgi:hypothetical protein